MESESILAYGHMVEVPDSAAPRWSARTLLVWLVLACLLPGILGAIALFIYEYRSDLVQLEATTLQTSRALTQAVDNYLLKTQAVAQTLSTADSLAKGDLAAFHRQAREAMALAGLGTNVVLRDEAGRQLLNTAVDFGQPLPHVVESREQVLKVFETKEPTVSGIFIGPVYKRPIMSVDVPVMFGDKVAYALGIGILPERFEAILKSQTCPPTG